MRFGLFALVPPVFVAAVPARSADVEPARQAALAAVDAHSSELVGLAQGFVVERGVAGLPTAFVASFGDPAQLAEARLELEEKTRGIDSVSHLPDGPPPIPED